MKIDKIVKLEKQVSNMKYAIEPRNYELVVNVRGLNEENEYEILDKRTNTRFFDSELIKELKKYKSKKNVIIPANNI